jgi:hypothetical protein
MKFVRVMVLFAGLCAMCGTVQAQWSTPIPLPADSGDDMSPVAIGGGDDGLFAAWFTRFSPTVGNQVRGCRLEGDTWRDLIAFSQPSTELASGPGMTADHLAQRLLVSYYVGGFPVADGRGLRAVHPVDDDTWGIYVNYADSTGQQTRRATGDTAVTDIAMRFNSAWQSGMFYSRMVGSGMDLHLSLFFSRLDGDTWTRPAAVARGTGSPITIDYWQPAIVGDTGSVFYLAYTRAVRTPPTSNTVYVRRYPDTATIGTFDGEAPALVSDWHGSLVLVNVVTDSQMNSKLLARFYTSGTWSAAETLDSDLFPGGRPTICIDTQPVLWVAYRGDYSAPPGGVRVCYYMDGRWHGPEEVYNGFANGTPFVVTTYFNNVWVLWEGLELGHPTICSATRLTRPGTAEGLTPCVRRITPGSTIVRGALNLSAVAGARGSMLLDISGRQVMALRPGPNDARHLAPGVYFIHTSSGVERAAPSVTRVVVTR